MSNYMNITGFAYPLLLVLLSIFKMAESNFPMVFYDSIYVPKTSGGVIVSPASLKATLAVAALAARGRTRKEIIKSIESTEINLEKDIHLPGKMKNVIQDRQIYVGGELFDSGLKEKLSSAYTIRSMDFGPRAASKTINYRVRDATKKWVGDILPNTLNKDTVLAAVNSFYMHANWKKEFTSTIIRGFKKPMIHQYGNFMFANLTDLNAGALLMDFKDNDAQLLVLQPYDNDLYRLGEHLLNEDLTAIPNQLKSTHMSLFFPIIKEIKMSLSVKDAMLSMGMDIALSTNANYGNLVDSCEEDYGLSLKALRHHTSFKAGRESARFVAVTGLQMDMNNVTRSSCSCLPDQYKVEFADPDEEKESISLSYRKKDAPHYYFEGKLFFALIKEHDVLFVGFLDKKK